jgi:hypothetical protein
MHMISGATGSRQTGALVLMFAIAAAGISLLASSRYGPQISPDSVAYISAATSLASEGNYTSFDGPYLRWPPLYPTILAVTRILGVDVAAGARFINAAAMAGIVLAAWSLFHRCLPDRRLALAATFAAVVSSPVQFVAAALWSEILFILFTMLFLLSLIRFLSNPNIGWLLLLGLLGCCALMQRYAGVAVLVTGGIAILVLASRSSLWKRLAFVAAFAALSTIPPLFWIKRSYALTGTPIGGRAPSPYDPMEVLHFFSQTILTWYVPGRLVPRPMPLVAAVMVVALCAFLVMWWRRKGPAGSPISSGIWPVILFAAVYSSFIIGTSIAFRYDQIGDRLLSPLAVYVAFFGFVAIQVVSTLTGRAEPGIRERVFRKSLLILMVGFMLAYPSFRTYSLTAASLAEGAGGYNSKLWRESEAIAWLRSSPEVGEVHSNGADAIYFLTGRPARWSPRGAVSSLPRPPIGVLWLDSKVNPYVYTPDELAAFYNVEVVRRFGDGTFYSLSSRD